MAPKSPNIGSRSDWLVERQNLLKKEKEATQLLDRLAVERRALPWVALEKEYLFQGERGDLTMTDLFADKAQLIVYHFMFGPNWEAGCKSCSFWADNFDGITAHLAARDISFVAISTAPYSKLAAFKKRMGWGFSWYSCAESEFNFDFSASFGEDHSPEDPVFYNFRETRFPVSEAVGISTFVKDDEIGRIYHTYSAYGRGVEMVNGAYHFMDMAPFGRQEDTANTMGWVRLHDQYGDVG